LSFSPFGVNTQRNAKSPIHDGMFGLPEVTLYRPSRVRTASAPLKRIQAFNSLTKAASAICAVLPWITYSSACSIAGRSVSSSNRTASELPARCSSASSSLDKAPPS